MESILEFARATPLDTLEQAQQFHAQLCDALQKNGKKLAGSIDRVLNDPSVLSPHQHGLTYLELLHYKLTSTSSSGSTAPTSDFIEQARTCFLSMQARDVLVGSKSVTFISRQLTKQLLATDRCMRGVAPLKAVVEKITAVSPSTLTSVHTDLMLLVLKSHSYDLIRDMAFLHADGSSSLLQVAPSSWPLEPIDFLQFWLYRGMHHAALKEYVAAEESFHMTLSIPTHGSSVSAVQVEAYKKMVLVGLLAHGEVAELNPRLCTTHLIRALELLSAPYLDLAKAYRKALSTSSSSASSTATQDLHTVIESHASQFLMDKNLGLVKQLLTSVVKRQVGKITQTYVTFSLQDVAKRINITQAQTQTKQSTSVGGAGAPAAAAATTTQGQQAPTPAQLAERYVFDMICAGDVFARLDSSASMVRFLDSSEEYDTTPFITRMEGRMASIVHLNQHLASKDRTLQLTPEFLVRTGQVKGVEGGKGGAGGWGGDEGTDMALARALSTSEVGGQDAFMQDDLDSPGLDEDEEMKAAMQASLMEH